MDASRQGHFPDHTPCTQSFVLHRCQVQCDTHASVELFDSSMISRNMFFVYGSHQIGKSWKCRKNKVVRESEGTSLFLQKAKQLFLNADYFERSDLSSEK